MCPSSLRFILMPWDLRHSFPAASLSRVTQYPFFRRRNLGDPAQGADAPASNSKAASFEMASC